MKRSFIGSIFAAGLAIIALMMAVPALAQTGTAPVNVSQAWFPNGNANLAVSGTTANVALPSGAGPIVRICNTGATNAFLAFGTSNAITAATTGWLIKSGTCIPYFVKPYSTVYTYVAAITATSTTTLYLETGIGSPGNN